MALTKMNDNPSRKTSSAVARCRVAALMLAVIAIAFALREHWGHIFGLSPYLLLLACPLMHLFMHHGHHKHGDSDHDQPEHRMPMNSHKEWIVTVLRTSEQRSDCPICQTLLAECRSAACN